MGMRRAIAVHKSGHWPEEAAADRVTLAFVDRHRRRLRLVADSGNPFLLDLVAEHADPVAPAPGRATRGL